MGLKKIRLARRAALFATFVAFALASGATPTPALAKYAGKHYRPAHQVKIHQGARPYGRAYGPPYGRTYGAPYGRAYGPAYGRLLGYALGIRPHYAYYAPRLHAYVPQFRAQYSYRPLVRHAYGRTCHTVSKIGYDGYGRKAKIGGTMCYDSYGNSYVVKGSRYVIHYY